MKRTLLFFPLVILFIYMGCATQSKKSDSSRNVASAEVRMQKIEDYKSTITPGTSYSAYIGGMLMLGLVDLDVVNANLDTYYDRNMKFISIVKEKGFKDKKKTLLSIIALNRESLKLQFFYIPDVLLAPINAHFDLAEKYVTEGNYKNAVPLARSVISELITIKKDINTQG